MPMLSKKVISNFLRSDCERRLRLDLVPDNSAYQAERQSQGMPPRDVARPGLAALTKAGSEWEIEKVNDLVKTFGKSNIIGNSHQLQNGDHSFSKIQLSQVINSAASGCFLVESEYDFGTSFLQAMDLNAVASQHNLNFSALRPDLIQVKDAGSTDYELKMNGVVFPVTPADTRIPLRVIDIKLTAEASVPYFMELTLYSMALAGWLQDNQLANKYFVSAQPAVWPGSHEASALVKFQNDCIQKHGRLPTNDELHKMLNEDLEECPVKVMAPRLKSFFKGALPKALATNWRNLDWHVDGRCVGCDYLGFAWGNKTPCPDHCWPMAKTQGHLSRVAFVSRGARNALITNQIQDVTALARAPSASPAFDSHHSLKAARTVVSGRAQALTTNIAMIPNISGGSAVMPAWADLRIYLSADFDVGSGITMAFGLSAVWAVSKNSVPAGEQNYNRWVSNVFPVDQRSIVAEERELLALLRQINDVLDNVSNRNMFHQYRGTQHPHQATFQVYIWDSVTYEHLTRVIGRHINVIMQNKALKHLAWLFPPDSIADNPDLSDRNCPITIVRNVAKAVLAAPVPHYYSLLNIARSYHSVYTKAPYNLFTVPGIFEDPLSSHIPSERAHEIWTKAPQWNRQLRLLESTVKTKLNALESVAQRLADDLKGQLNQTAPRIADLRPPTLLSRAADDARLWFVFARLNTALQELEIQKIHAMPPHEREAKFKSARLLKRVSRGQETAILSAFGLTHVAYRRVYELSRDSREVSAREGDFSFAISPEGDPGFLSKSISKVAGNIGIALPAGGNPGSKMNRVMQVTIKGIDRDQGFIVIDLDRNWDPVIATLENAGKFDLSQDVILDPVSRDFFIERLKTVLNAIGNPPIAAANSHPGISQATGRSRSPRPGTDSPVASVYWDSQSLYHSPTNRVLVPAKQELVNNGVELNPSQWDAWENSLSHRLRLIWGPPGTGKSRTLRAIVLGAIVEATQQSRQMRVLITGPTYESIDNVLLEIYSALSGTSGLANSNVEVARLRSSYRVNNSNIPANIDITLNSRAPQVAQLIDQLLNQNGIVVVGATAQQTYKLQKEAGRAVSPLFDLIVVDEASQLDVAQSTLSLSALAENGSVVIAGDPKQLPPIHAAESPVGLESMVGPVFSYFQDRFSLAPCVLTDNYRSCSQITEFGYEAGYRRTLNAYSPDMTINIISPLSATSNPPSNWPSNLYWTPDWLSVLEPDKPVTCFVYPEGRSSQWNIFEAEAIASLTWILYGRLGNKLVNEKDPSTGIIIPNGSTPYDAANFWKRGVGVVTPHRAQQALVISKLQSLFPNYSGQDIRNAVDTVERFQGQQRDIMLATFALGDPDAIADEDEFLMSLNRFNVMASRARAKLVVLVSQEVVDHLSSDMNTLHQSALLKGFAETYCNQRSNISLGYINNGVSEQVIGELRIRQ